MTIKQRLRLSNIMMILTPVIMLAVFLGLAALIFTQTIGKSWYQRWETNEIYGNIYADLERKAPSWEKGDSDLETIKTDIHEILQNKNKSNIGIYIYQDQQPVYTYGKQVNGGLLDLAIQKNDNQNLVENKMIIHTFDLTKYKVLISYTNYTFGLGDEIYDYQNILIAFIVFVALFTLLIIFILNRILIRFVFNTINQSLDILITGVEQITAGNLDYRIDYQGKDEFTQVIADFNAMAGQLQKLSIQRQRDERSRRELIAGISHDLRTPLTSIKGFVEGLEKGVARTPAKQAHYLSIIKTKTEDLEHIITQLFLFSKLDVGELALNMEIVDAQNFLEDFVATNKEEYVIKGLQLQLQIKDIQAKIRLDISQMHNVMINLLENSLKYGAQKNGIMQISAVQKEQRLYLTFIDNGKGVSEAVLPNLFDVFYRGDQARTHPSNGSGLGLAIAKKIVTSFGGEISAFNAPTGALGLEIILPIITEV